MPGIYQKGALTGGTSDALDSIDGANLTNGDRAIVVSSTYVYFYYLNATSGASESSPDVIAPDTNPGNKRWIRQAAFGVVDFTGPVEITGSDARLRLQDDDDASSYFEIDDDDSGQTTINKYADSGASYLDLNSIPGDGTSISNIRVWRDTNTSGVKRMILYKGDGSASEQHRLASGADTYLCADNGNFGVGTTSPSNKVHINSGTSDIALLLESSDAGAGLQLKDNTKTSQIHQSAGALFLTPDTADTTDAVVVYNNACYPKTNNYLTSGTASLAWSNVYGVNAYTTTSDERLKHKIKDIDPEKALVLLLAMEPFLGNWKTQVVETEMAVPATYDEDGNELAPETTTMVRSELADSKIHAWYGAQDLAAALTGIGYDYAEFAGISNFELDTPKKYIDDDGSERALTESWNVGMTELIPIIGAAIKAVVARQDDILSRLETLEAK